MGLKYAYKFLLIRVSELRRLDRYWMDNRWFVNRAR